MMFPPYTFGPEYLIREEDSNRTRVVNANEREKLMGLHSGLHLSPIQEGPEGCGGREEAGN